jgi:predicted transport protein
LTEIKLFSTGSTVKERVSSEAVLERDLQSLIEKNMELFFGVRFLKSEYAITNGRMDSVGIDENNSPVIFEYKRSQNENVISQGLFYLDWLLDHKADFKLLVMEKLGMQAAQTIDWSVPCVICIARDFTRYDIHAVNQMQRNIKLVSYRKYDDDLILFEHLNAPNVKSLVENGLLDGAKGGAQKSSGEKTHVEKLALASESIKTLYHSICDFIESLGDDIAPNQLKLYLAYKKVQNMVCIELHNKQVVLFIKISPDTVSLEDGFTRDMRGVGHYGTGDLQVIIKNAADFEKAKPLLERAYREG